MGLQIPLITLPSYQITKMKRVRKPLTDINGRDFMTGAKVEAPKLEQEKNVDKKIKQRLEKKIKESAVKGKIYVEGLGYVKVS